MSCINLNPLLNIPIARRLAIGFLVPALITAAALCIIGVRSVQLLSEESLFYQNLMRTYTSLTIGSSYLQQMDATVHQTLADAANPHLPPQTVQGDEKTMQDFATRYNSIIQNDALHTILQQHADLAQLFTDAGHSTQIDQQQFLSEEALLSWQAYYDIQKQVLQDIRAGQLNKANALESVQANAAFSDTLRDLQQVIALDGSLVPSIEDAAHIEENVLVAITVVAALSALLGIGIVGWLVSSTLVRRLQELRSMVQRIEAGQVDARLTVRGRDEIAEVAGAVNSMLDTIVGLLEKTRRQRDELASAEVLQRLHQQLQREHEALNQANAQLQALATTDPLTGLPNHRTIMSRLEEELAHCQRSQTPCAILFVDLDHFKRINDRWGHAAGDAILYEASTRLRNSVRSEDFVGRYGGEEFIVVLTNISPSRASSIAERLRSTLAATPCLWNAEEHTQFAIPIPITASIGVAVYGQHGTTRETLIEAADQAMYRAKHTGRNRVCLANEEESLPIKEDTLHAREGVTV